MTNKKKNLLWLFGVNRKICPSGPGPLALSAAHRTANQEVASLIPAWPHNIRGDWLWNNFRWFKKAVVSYQRKYFHTVLVNRLEGRTPPRNSLNRVSKGVKDQESIQSSTTPDPGYQLESDKLTLDTTNENQEVSPFPAGDHKAHIRVIVKIRQNSCPFHILWKPLMWSWIFFLHTILLIILNKASW